MGNHIQKATRSFLLLGLFFAHASAQNAAQRLPATPALPTSLTNSQYWGIITEFSEDGGSFPSDNYTSNELQIGQVATELINRGRTGGAYLGVGPEQNFTYIAALKPEIVFIVDIRRQAVMQHLMYKAVFEMSSNRSEFISRLFSKPLQPAAQSDTSLREIWIKYLTVPADTALYRNNIAAIHNHLAKVRGFALTSADSATIALVYDTFYRYGPAIQYSSRAGGMVNPTASTTTANFLSLTLIADTSGVARSFLATDENYQFLRGLHSRNLIIPVVGNFGGPQALRKVGDYLREHRAVVNGHYVSNVEQYLFRPPTGIGIPVWQEYYTSVGLLPMDSASVFIRSNSARVNSAQVLQLMQGLPQAPGFRMLEMRLPGAVAAGPPAPAVMPVQPQQQPYLGSVTGTVRDSASGNPLALATVTILGTAAGAVTTVNGEYTIPNVAPGLYTVGARRVGYAAANVPDVRVAAGAPTVVDLRTTVQALILSGVVTTGGGTFTVGRLTTSGGSASGVVLCPMQEFIAAYKDGRVTNYQDATRCVR